MENYEIICAVTYTEEMSYRNLTSGAWLTGPDAVYATIHRSAVSQKHQGKSLAGRLFASVEEMAGSAGIASVRVDTHPDNKGMQRTLEKAGYIKCNELILTGGDEAGELRYGYEKFLAATTTRSR